MKRTLLLPFLFAVCFCSQVLSQTTNASYKLFFEKVYLHTDREFYTSGDDIWFKAYLVNGQTHQIFDSSNNLYVELINAESKIVDRKTIRFDKGLAAGDFKLSDSVLSGTFRLRAYTNWMRNFGDDFFFEKRLSVASTADFDEGGDRNAKNQQVVSTNQSGNSAAVPGATVSKLSFFPEGGSMVADVSSVVAFKAEDGGGKGVSVTGNIEAEDGSVIATLTTSFDGMGRFLLQPRAGKTYRAKGKYADGKTFDIKLPAALTTGFGIYVRQSDSVFSVAVKTNQPTYYAMAVKQLAVVIKNRGKAVYGAKVPLSEEQTIFAIPKAGLPAGVNAITLYDDKGRPICERLIFVSEAQADRLLVTADKQSYSSKEKTTLSIKARDANNQPLRANLSLSVVDGGLVPESLQGNIVSYLNLQSELKGTIENPSKYFDEKNASRNPQMDLLLLCVGWRDFLWKRLAETPVSVSYHLEKGITVAGMVRDKFSKKPIGRANVTLTAFGARDNKLFSTQADSSGLFYVDGINFYGLQTVKLTSTDSKGVKKGEIFVDTTIQYPLVVPYTVVSDSVKRADAVYTAALQPRYEILRRQRLSDTMELAEVVIKAAPKPYVTKSGATLREFNYPVEEFKVTLADHGYTDLKHFLTHRVRYGNAIVANSDFKGYSRPIIIVNGQEMISSQIGDDNTEVTDATIELFYRQSMKIIKSVTVKHLLEPAAGGSIDRYLLFLTMDLDAFNGIRGVETLGLTGYYEAREFYKPNYQTPGKQTDLRTTIHWEPMLGTNSNGEATITYYNADPKTKVRIIAEGITESGKPITGTAGYEIK